VTTGKAQRTQGFGARLAAAPIRAYKRFVSPLMPPACRFEPTCSVYALEAIAEHGALKGLFLATRRLLRCHPITWLGGASGFDPVPHAHSSKTRHP
jgi:putative membrane protein insertion efficiency factor